MLKKGNKRTCGPYATASKGMPCQSCRKIFHKDFARLRNGSIDIRGFRNACHARRTEQNSHA
eukprot:12099918-Karenia_brevis.AAC.1